MKFCIYATIYSLGYHEVFPKSKKDCLKEFNKYFNTTVQEIFQLEEKEFFPIHIIFMHIFIAAVFGLVHLRILVHFFDWLSWLKEFLSKHKARIYEVVGVKEQLKL